MLMTDIDDEGELRAVLDEMVGNLHVDIQVGDAVVSVPVSYTHLDVVRSYPPAEAACQR